MRLGAFTFLTKPVDAHDLIPIIMQAAEPETPTESMVGDSPGLQTINQIVKQVGSSSEPVFLRGEPGVGKRSSSLECCMTNGPNPVHQWW